MCALTTNYFIVTQRYTCSCCASRASNTKLTIEAVAKATGLGDEDAIIKPQYTFMGYDPCSHVHLPHGYGDEYPAFHKYKGALDLLIIDLMKPLFNKGVHPVALSDILLELHAKKYTHDYLKREQNLARDFRLGIIAPKVKTMFLSFGNKEGYAGLVPTGNYLFHVYKLFAASIGDHLAKEVKNVVPSTFIGMPRTKRQSTLDNTTRSQFPGLLSQLQTMLARFGFSSTLSLMGMTR